MTSSASPCITAILLGTAPSAAAAQDIRWFSTGCPYVHAYHCSGQTLLTVFVLPESKRAWVAALQQHPELIGLEQAAVFFTTDLALSSPWSTGLVQPVVCDHTPCGSTCPRCPLYHQSCTGCPATMWSLPAGA